MGGFIVTSTVYTVVADREDSNIEYWVAWQEADNPKGFGGVTKFRVFRDDRNKTKAVPITEPLSEAEAYERLDAIKILIGA
jgi:hypothetical protein